MIDGSGLGSGVAALDGLSKAATGIPGLDAVTAGGLPRGRTTLLCGGPGCGKTLMAMQFLVRGALDAGEPGVFVAFEESPAELAQNVSSLGWDLQDLQARGLLAIDHVRIGGGDVVITGEWDLEGLFIRLGAAIDSVGARRVVLDTVESLFGPLGDASTLRAELRRLFRWLNDRGVTAIVTGERGDGSLTRHGLEEYVSDCVVLLDHRVHDQISTRRLRVVKYRGSDHGPDEYPFLLDRNGFSVLPVSSMGLDHETSDERVSTGVEELDRMLDGGPYRGSSVLISGTPGSGKTTLGARFLEAGCERGERGIAVRVRGVPVADRSQHARGRDRRSALGGCGDVADRLCASGRVWVGDASGADVPGDRGVRPGERRDRSAVGVAR